MKPTAPLRSNRRCSDPVACLDYVYFFCAFLLAAHRAFINCESLLRPAAVIPPLFARGLSAPSWPPLTFAALARAAAATLARLEAAFGRPRLLRLVICGAWVPPNTPSS